MPAEATAWALESFLDSLIYELDRAQDTLALKGLTRKLTYTVKDVALDLHIFPRYEQGGEVRFTAARPGEAGASKLSIQLGSITDRQIRESGNEPPDRDDVEIEVLEELDDDVKRSLKKVGVRSSRDLERIGSRNVDLEQVVRDKTGSRKGVQYNDLARLISKARRRGAGPLVKKVSAASSADGSRLVLEGENLASAQSVDGFPAALLNGAPVTVRHAAGSRLELELPAEGLRPGANQLDVALDPYALMRLEVRA